MWRSVPNPRKYRLRSAIVDKCEKAQSKTAVNLQKMPPRQQRRPNWSGAEIEALLGQVEQRRAVIFCSVSGGLTGHQKDEAWARTTEAVNAASSVGRTAAEVKKKWTDLKSDSKKRVAKHRRETQATRGAHQQSTPRTSGACDHQQPGHVPALRSSGLSPGSIPSYVSRHHDGVGHRRCVICHVMMIGTVH